MTGRQYKFRCEICNTNFQNGNNLHRHLKSSKCMRGSSLVGYFHREVEAKQTPSYICGNCNREFANGSVLELHLAGRECIQENAVEQITCGVCKMCFKSADEVSRHIATSHAQNQVPKKEDLFSCGRCQAEFESVASLQRHVLSNVCMTVSSFDCGICQASFQEAEMLNSHMLAHVAERSTENPPTICAYPANSQTTYARPTNPQVNQHQACKKSAGETQVEKSQLDNKKKKKPGRKKAEKPSENQSEISEPNKNKVDKKKVAKLSKKQSGNKKQADTSPSEKKQVGENWVRPAETTKDIASDRQKTRCASGDNNKSATSISPNNEQRSTQGSLRINEQPTPTSFSPPKNTDPMPSSSTFQPTTTTASSSGSPIFGISALCPTCNKPGSITKEGFVCGHCRLRFSNFKCEHCSIVFPEMSVLVDHLKNSCKETATAGTQPIEVKQETEEDPSYGATPETFALSKDDVRSPTRSTITETLKAAEKVTDNASKETENNEKTSEGLSRGKQMKWKASDVLSKGKQSVNKGTGDSSKDDKIVGKIGDDESAISTDKTIQTTVSPKKPSTEQMKACISKFREYIQAQAKQLNLSPVAKKDTQPESKPSEGDKYDDIGMDASILTDSESEISDSSGFEEIDINEDDLEDIHVSTTVDVSDKTNIAKSNEVETVTSFLHPSKQGSDLKTLNKDSANYDATPLIPKNNKAIPNQAKPLAQPLSDPRKTNAPEKTKAADKTNAIDKSKEIPKKAAMYVMETDEDSSDSETVAKKAAKQGKRVQIGILDRIKQANPGIPGKSHESNDSLQQKEAPKSSEPLLSQNMHSEQTGYIDIAEKVKTNHRKTTIITETSKTKAIKRKRKGRPRKSSEDETDESSDEDDFYRKPKKKRGRQKKAVVGRVAKSDKDRKFKTKRRLKEDTVESSYDDDEFSHDDDDDDFIPYQPRKKQGRPKRRKKDVETDDDSESEEILRSTPKRTGRRLAVSESDDDSLSEEVLPSAPKRIVCPTENSENNKDSQSEKVVPHLPKQIAPKKCIKSPESSKKSDRESDTSVTSRKITETPKKGKQRKQTENNSDDANANQKEKDNTPIKVKKGENSSKANVKSDKLKKKPGTPDKKRKVVETDDDSDVEDFVCGECKMYFATLTSLRKHLKTHKEVLEEDNEKEAEEISVKTHVPVKQMVIKPTGVELSDQFVCGICQVQASSVAELAIHMQVHTTTFKFVCNVCEQTFPTLVALQQHSKEHVPQTEEFVCGLCSSTFYSITGLETHMIKHASKAIVPGIDAVKENTTLTKKIEESPPVKRIAADSTQVSDGSASKSGSREPENKLKPAEKDVSPPKKGKKDVTKKEKSSTVSLLLNYKPPKVLFK